MRITGGIIISGVLLCCLLQGSSAIDPLTAIKKGAEKSLDIAKEAADFVPDPSDVANLGKDLVFGVPIKVILEGLNKYCSLALATEDDVERTREVVPTLGNVSLQFLDMKYNRSFDLTSVQDMVQLDTFNKDFPTVILTTGWLSMDDNKTNRAAKWILDAYNCRGDVNFILFDSGEYINTIYTWSAKNTEELGHFLAEFLIQLVNYIDLEKIHLIGHSLGAQISGEAGRQFQDRTDTLLKRITGLDPALPCFNEGEVLNGVGRGDAEFVDVIHSNNGALGQRNPIADADFYPNGVVILQPGSFSVSTSHSRAYELYAESVYPGNENTFMATRCNSMYSLNAGLCTKGATPMGFAASSTAKGNFFVKTEKKSPYGMNKMSRCGGGGEAAGQDDSQSNKSSSSTTEASDSGKAASSTSTEGSTRNNEAGSTTSSPVNVTSTTTKETPTTKKFLGIFG